MADIKLATGNVLLKGDANGTAQVGLFGTDGSSLSKVKGSAASVNDQAITIGGLNDDNYRTQRMDRLGSNAVALNNILFHEPFEGSTISTPNRITVTSTTFTQAQTSTGGLSLNNTASNSTGAAVMVVSNKQFIKTQRQPLQFKIRARVNQVAGSVTEFGFGSLINQTTSPTVGSYFQITSGGVVQGVLTFNGVDVTTSDMASSLPGGWQNNYYTWDIILDDDEVVFIIQNTSTGLILAERRIQLSATQPKLWNSTHLPIYSRLHNSGSPVTAPNLLISSIDVISLDAFMNKPWGQTMASNGLGSEVGPTTFTQSTNWVNSTAPTSATLSNTTAGYTTLGGLFQFAATAGAATDYVLFAYGSPAPYSFICTGIDIDCWNTGAPVATTPSLLVWGVSPDQTAISLATATNRRIGLGSQSFPIGAAVGATVDRQISRDFSGSPLVTNSGRFLVIILRLPVGTATASQVIQGMVNIKGYFE